MMFSIRSFVLYAVDTSMCGGLLVLLCLPLCALLRRLRAPSKLLCLLWLAVGLRFLLPGGIPVSIRQPGSAAPIQQAGAVVQALTVPAELPAQALPARQAVLPCPAACLTSGWYWQRSGLRGSGFTGACGGWLLPPAPHGDPCLQNAGWLLHLRRGCHAVHTWRAAPPHLYAAKPAGFPTPCGTAA